MSVFMSVLAGDGDITCGDDTGWKLKPLTSCRGLKRKRHSHRIFAQFKYRKPNLIANHCACICGQGISLLDAVKADNLEASGRLDSELHFRVQTNPARFWPPPFILSLEVSYAAGDHYHLSPPNHYLTHL